MNVLITGNAGYVGGALTDLITGHELLGYDNLTYEDSYQKDIPFVYGDIRDKKKLKLLLEWADAVVWLAAIVGDGACQVNPSLTKEVNEDSVKWLADNFDGRIIFTSTCSVYGAQEGLLDESSPTNPLSLYASTKLNAERFLESKNAIIFRLGTLFGVSDEFSRIRLDLVVNTMTARAVSEGKLQVFGGEQYRPLIHVKDVAKMIADSIDSRHTGIYNLHAENMKMIDLAKLVTKHVPSKLDVVETSFEDSRNYMVSSDKAKSIGFGPLYTVESGIKQVATLLGSGRIKDLNSPRYSNQLIMEVIHGN